MNLFSTQKPSLKPKVSNNLKSKGTPLSVGAGFDALSFRHNDFATGFDPLIMVDHYVMTAPTFGAHPHAGLSAVSMLFDDSIGKFHNTDSMGNDFDLEPGDLYWLKAGSGAVHDERPRPGAKTHGLQMFVNIPNQDKNTQPDSLHVKASDMPVIAEEGHEIRLVLGNYLDKSSQASPSIPMNILDGKLHSTNNFEYPLETGFNAWIYVVSGAIGVQVGESSTDLKARESIAIDSCVANGAFRLLNQHAQVAHFVIVSAEPLNESFVQQGPLVASDDAAMKAVIAREKAGLFGGIA